MYHPRFGVGLRYQGEIFSPRVGRALHSFAMPAIQSSRGLIANAKTLLILLLSWLDALAGGPVAHVGVGVSRACVPRPRRRASSLGSTRVGCA